MSDSDGHDPFLIPEGSVLNRQIMLISAATLSLVMLLVISVYLYARCVLITHQSRRTRRLTLTLHLRHTDHSTHTEFEPTTTGLDPSIIAALPVFNVKDVGVNSVTECAVCLSSLEDEEMAKLLPNCKHYFHVGCIDTWLASHSTCPLCRARIQPLLEPQLREGPTALSLDVVPLSVQVLPVLESSQGTSDGGGGVGESSKIEGSTSRLSSFRRVLSRERSSRRTLQLSSHDGVGRDLERQ